MSDDNPWLVAFRVGLHYGNQGYMFWYRTKSGKWARKQTTHEGQPSVLLDDLPSDGMSPGWKLDNTVAFYDSDVIYYIITQGG